VGRKLSQVMWFECFEILTHKILQFICIGGRVGGNVLNVVVF
jgi:hypothetical protein